MPEICSSLRAPLARFQAARRNHSGVSACPLSMLLLTSLMTAWVEFCQKVVPQSILRSYADDLSVIAAAPSKPALKAKISQVHQIASTFATDCGMSLNKDKSFTFGDKCLAESISSLPNHTKQFRLVGGSISIQKHSNCSRQQKWQRTVETIRRLPVGWLTKVKSPERAYSVELRSGYLRLQKGRRAPSPTNRESMPSS